MSKSAIAPTAANNRMAASSADQQDQAGRVASLTHQSQHGEPGQAHVAMAGFPLLIAIAIALLLSIYPNVLATADGKANHTAAMWAMWAMTAGFVRGVGFIPRNALLRLTLSRAACYLALICAIYKMW